MAELNQMLAQSVQALGLDLSADQQAMLLEYLAQMQRWNRTYNLTSIRDPQQMLVQHVVDSLAVVKPFAEALGDQSATIADIGSGGGLPGVVLAVACSTWTIHCVDAVEKKMAFVRQISGVLGLPNLKAVHGRVEELPLLEADLVVSRAFASLLDFATLAGRHVGPKGRLVAMKGRYPEEEITALQLQGEWQVQSVQQLNVPLLQAQRCLVWICRQGNS
ncbi:MAG TPA: 16S rRNA (guanine(527)-N(7))-methyltransferase RsmG [Pusillimonas sp.]|uniref:16S rRNA (guanine(527)-N(7))-methyltransferase RsmG n=1 Tax=Pusillimonas sp. TaxID=3040095 RepID=UPI002C94AD86|nr:16S rRNA (guanine(527)-N(7))-methyltransferase RsmG [Pusillimonas sp.]HUH86618.1 16S rRNA (guanine(527)-N(7))-methyltransferase RsmG [Pusillimonas sp.]